MLLSDFIRRGSASLETLYPSPEARGLVLMLCEERLGVKSYTHIVEPGYEIPADRLAELEGELGRLAAGEPIQYVLGYADFCGRRFRVNPSVLIPRPETELLVGEAVSELLARERPCRALDLCTGSGCIAWSLALEVRGTEVVAVDISDDALAVARSQFEEETGPLFVKADVLDTEQPFGHGEFDVLVCNPPYVMDSERARMRPNVLEHEPELALFVPDSDPLKFYRAAARWAQRFLRADGVGIVEINEALGPGTEAVFREAGFGKTQIIRDFASKSRFVKFSRA